MKVSAGQSGGRPPCQWRWVMNDFTQGPLWWGLCLIPGWHGQMKCIEAEKRRHSPHEPVSRDEMCQALSLMRWWSEGWPEPPQPSGGRAMGWMHWSKENKFPWVVLVVPVVLILLFCSFALFCLLTVYLLILKFQFQILVLRSHFHKAHSPLVHGLMTLYISSHLSDCHPDQDTKHSSSLEVKSFFLNRNSWINQMF